MRNRIAGFCRRHEEILFWLVIGISLDAAFLMIKDAPLVADEGYHLPQISSFLRGSFEVSPHLTVLPVYHAAMAAILKLIGAGSVAEARMITFLGSAVSIWFFHLIVRRLWPEERYLRTAQFVFLPILFPMHFLIYTDTWALAFVLVALERTLADRPWQSAAAIMVAVLLRQPHLVWAGMMWVLLVWQPGPFHTIWRFIKDHWRQTTLPFALLFAAFCGFFVINRGIAIGDKQQHEIGLNLANLWFFGLCFFFAFLPTCLGTVCRHWGNLRRHPAGATVVSAAGFGLFLSTYHASHQYNQPTLWFYLRNRILYVTTQTPALKVITFIPVSLGLACFLLAPMKERRFRILIPISLASITVMPLIEQRYYLVPFSMFLAFRTLEHRSLEWINLGFFICAAFGVQLAVSRNLFFF